MSKTCETCRWWQAEKSTYNQELKEAVAPCNRHGYRSVASVGCTDHQPQPKDKSDDINS